MVPVGLVRPKVAAIRQSRLITIAGSIVGSQIVTSLLGFVFWTVAAHGVSPVQLGELGSATAAVMLLGIAGVFGCGTLLIGRLATTPPERRRELLATAILVSVLVGLLLSAIFGIGSWLLLPSFHYFAPQATPFWWLLAAGALTSLGGVFDQAMLVLGKPTAQVLRNAVASALKIVVLVVALGAGHRTVTWGLAAWAIGQLVADGLAFRAAWRNTPKRSRVRAAQIMVTARTYWRETICQHGVNVALAAPSLAQPVIISAVISAESNALFTAVRLVSMFAFMAPYALATALFAVGSADRGRDQARARAVFWLSLRLSTALSAVLFVSAPIVLAVFGSRYASGGAAYLRIIVLACPLLVFKDQFIAQMRVRLELKRVIPYVVLSSVGEVTGTLIGSFASGLAGALVGWLIALGLGAVWVVSRWRLERNAEAGELAR